jgi:hypothetical protein
METTKDKRTNLELSNQAKNLFIQVYESKNGTNLYGFIPSVGGQEYHIAKKECISICDRYSDNRLKDEFIRNY